MTDWLNTSLVINKYKTKTMGSNSCVTVLRQVVLGLPGFLLPGGVHLKATFVMWSCSILRTCPSHLRRLCVISLVMLRLPVFLYSSLLEIVFGQKIWHICLRHLLWNTSIFLVDIVDWQERVFLFYIWFIVNVWNQNFDLCKASGAHFSCIKRDIHAYLLLWAIPSVTSVISIQPGFIRTLIHKIHTKPDVGAVAPGRITLVISEISWDAPWHLWGAVLWHIWTFFFDLIFYINPRVSLTIVADQLFYESNINRKYQELCKQ